MRIIERVWHSCEDRLPDNEELVLVAVQEPRRWYTAKAAYIGGEWYLDGCERVLGRVLQWAEERDA